MCYLTNLINYLSPLIKPPLFIVIGAAFGALSRYYLTLKLSQLLCTDFPVATFIINLSGALVIGFFATFVVEEIAIASDIQKMIGIGFLGSYTTFSTYVLETNNLLEKHQQTAVAYWLGSAILGVLCIQLGVWLAKKVI